MRQKIEKHIWVYVAWLLVAVAVWFWIFDGLTAYKREEKVNIFLSANTSRFEQRDILNDPANRPSYLEIVEVNAHSIRDSLFLRFLETQGQYDADILVLPQSYMANNLNWFSPISTKYQEIFANLGWYSAKDGTVYGIKVYDAETGTSLISCLDFAPPAGEDGQDFYLVFHIDSPHLSDLSSGEPTTMNGAIELAKVLLTL